MWTSQEKRGASFAQPISLSLPFSSPEALKILQNTSSLPIQEGQALQLLCVADSNPSAQLSWFQGSPTLEATPISSTEVLEIPQWKLEIEKSPA